MKNLLFSIVLTLSIFACTNNSKKENNLFTEEMVKLLNLQDQRKGDSILPFLKSTDANVREKAALAFASIINPKYYASLKNTLVLDSSIKVKTACALAIGQLRDSNYVTELISMLNQAQSMGITDSKFTKYMYGAIGKCGGINDLFFFLDSSMHHVSSLSHGMLRYAYQNRTYDPFYDQCIRHMQSREKEVRMNASIILNRVFGRNPKYDKDTVILNILIQKEQDQDVKYILTKIAERFIPSTPTSPLSFDEFQEIASSEKSPYSLAEKIQTITIESYSDLDNLLHLALSHKEAIVRTEAANTLVNKLASKKLVINKKPKSYYLTELLNSDDMALQSVATYGIKNPDVIDLEEARLVYLKRLSNMASTFILPREKETYLDIQKTISYLKEEKYQEEKPDLSHQIDWEYINKTEINPKVLIQTDKGDITITCFTKDAPGSVCNFLKLVDSGYYDNKPFHRVVPNFVIQTGCNRGDGWGAPNWTQRSEFSNFQSYTPGTVGLASAGNDTEGFQWFITHTYTPFLDGRYSIFARVTKGMKIVENIKFGDKIHSVQRIK